MTKGIPMTMREKMAEAMYAAIHAHDSTEDDGHPGTLADRSKDLQRLFMAMTDAGLDALLEPTDGMTDAMMETNNCNDSGNYLAVWTFAIAAAKQGK